jgi:hypothetical protein
MYSQQAGHQRDEPGPHPREVRNGCIFRFVCLEGVACDPDAGAQHGNGRPAVALAEDLCGRPVPAGAVSYARSRPEMAGEARPLRWLLQPPRRRLLHFSEPHNSEPVFIEAHGADRKWPTSRLPLIARHAAPGARRNSRSSQPRAFRSGGAIRPWSRCCCARESRWPVRHYPRWT